MESVQPMVRMMMLNGVELPVYVLSGPEEFASFGPILLASQLGPLKVSPRKTIVEAATTGVNPEIDQKINLTMEHITGLWKSTAGEDKGRKMGKRLPPTTKSIKKPSALAQLRTIREEARSRSRSRDSVPPVFKVTRHAPTPVLKEVAPFIVHSSIAANPRLSDLTAFERGLTSRRRLLLVDQLLDLWDAYTDSHYMHVTMTNFQEGKMKHCRIDVEAAFSVEGDDLTWDKARAVAVWQALLRLDESLCEDWLHLHPAATYKYPFLSHQ